MAEKETDVLRDMIIIDTNVFIAMQIKPGIVRKNIIHNHDRFVAPDFMFILSQPRTGPPQGSPSSN